MVQYSLIILLSPITTLVSLSINFLSCGIFPIIVPEKISHPLPISVPDLINTFECILVFSPIITLSSI